jgi:hypothetical protein
MKLAITCILIGSFAVVALAEPRGPVDDKARATERSTVFAETSTWSGRAIVEESDDGALTIIPGDGKRMNVGAIDLHLPIETTIAREADPDLILPHATGSTRVTYLPRLRTWIVDVVDEASGESFYWRIERPIADNLESEVGYPAQVDRFFGYLCSPDPPAIGGVAGPHFGPCPSGYSCCSAGECEAQCMAGQYAVCTLKDGGCTARCRAIMV